MPVLLAVPKRKEQPAPAGSARAAEERRVLVGRAHLGDLAGAALDPRRHQRDRGDRRLEGGERVGSELGGAFSGRHHQRHQLAAVAGKIAPARALRPLVGVGALALAVLRDCANAVVRPRSGAGGVPGRRPSRRPTSVARRRRPPALRASRPARRPAPAIAPR